MHNESITFILYFFKMFFAFEAVFIGLVQPKIADFLPPIKVKLKEIINTAENQNTKTTNNTPMGVLKKAGYWADLFPKINNINKKITIISLIVGIPLNIFIYYLHHINLININYNFITLIIIICFLYMFIKLSYYTFQYIKINKFKRDLELIFNAFEVDKKIRNEILTNCNLLDKIN